MERVCRLRGKKFISTLDWEGKREKSQGVKKKTATSFNTIPTRMKEKYRVSQRKGKSESRKVKHTYALKYCAEYFHIFNTSQICHCM